MTAKQPDARQDSQAFILFELAGTTYAVRTEAVQQVEMVEHITSVPNAPPAVEGVVFSRGQVIPALNLRARFGFERVEHDLRTRLIIVNVGGRVVGLLVDSAREFASIPADAIQPPGDAITGTNGRYIEAIASTGGRLILILNVEEVLRTSDAAAAGDPQAIKEASDGGSNG